MGSPAIRFRTWLLSALLLLGSWAAVLLVDRHSLASRWTSNIGLIVAAFLGAAGCLSRSRKGDRAPWLLIGLGALSWGLGQCAWTWYESILGQQVPFPSLANVGYLLSRSCWSAAC